MPLLYATRSDRVVLALTGADRVRFLHGMVTNDIKKLATDQGCHAALLSQKGRFVADLVVYARADELWVETDRATFDKVWEIFDHHLMADDVELVDRREDLSLSGLYALDTSLPVDAPLYGIVEHEGALVAGTRELGMPGLRIFGSSSLGDGAVPLSAAELETYRIEAGTPRYGLDMDEERLFLEAGIADAVSYDKGCYLGQEVVVRAQSRGALNRRLMGLVLDGDAASPLPERGTKLATPERPEAGYVTSATYSPSLQRPIALGYVHKTAWTPGTIVQLGDRRATVAALPLVDRT
jgi:folate-binding protein YgfZ